MESQKFISCFIFLIPFLLGLRFIYLSILEQNYNIARNPFVSHRVVTVLAPNPSLNSDPACIARRPLSATRFLGSAQRLGAGGAG